MHRYSHYKASNFPDRIDDNKERFDYNDQIPWHSMKKLIDNLRYMGVESVLLSGGGEPTIYPHFNELMNELEDFHVAIITNGSFYFRTNQFCQESLKLYNVSIYAFNLLFS